MNTLNAKELEEALKRVVEKHHLRLDEGIKNGYMKLEDGLPWVELVGEMDSKKAKEIIQDLADELDIRVLFNKLRKDSGEDKLLCAVLDINDEEFYNTPQNPISALSNDPDAKEFMDDYGKEFLPKSAQKTKKVKP